MGKARQSGARRLALAAVLLALIILGMSVPMLGIFWWLVQHEPVVLLTQNIFLIVAIVGLILYSMIHKRQDQNNNLAYGIAAVAIVSGILAVFANLHPPAWMADFSAAYAEQVMYLSIILIVGFVIYGFLTHYSEEFGRTVVLMILILSTIVFWALFEQSAASMTLFADRVMDRQVFGLNLTAGKDDGSGRAVLEPLPASCVQCARLLDERRAMYEDAGVFPSSVIDYQIELLKSEDDEKLNRDFSRLPAEERLVATRELMHKDIHRH